MKKILSLITLLFVFISLLAQTTKEEMLANLNKCGGVYFAYPGPTQTNYTKPPKGYKPFYISHYGRHGSRWRIDPNDYKYIQDILNDAYANNALTTKGKNVKSIVDMLCIDAEGRYGELTALGNLQHRQIAYRMYHNFPRVFKCKKYIESRSSTIQRCIISMAAFDEQLKELNPKLTFTRECGQRFQKYLANWDNWYEIDMQKYDKDIKDSILNFTVRNFNPDRLMKYLFSDVNYYNNKVRPNAIMFAMKLYDLQSNIQDIDIDVSLTDIFTPDELFILWQAENINAYYEFGPSPISNNLLNSQINLVNNIITSADNAISTGSPAATLRFGHDCIVSPLAAFLGLKNCTAPPASTKLDNLYKYWTDFKVIPMGANIQLIFYKKCNSEDIIVKILFNENETEIIDLKSDIAPYYHWQDLKAYLNLQIRKYK